MSSALSTELKKKCNVPCRPIWKDDKVQVVQGHYKGQQTGPGFQEEICHLHMQWEETNGATVHVTLTPAVVIAKLTQNEDCTVVLGQAVNPHRVGTEKHRRYKRPRRCGNRVSLHTTKTVQGLPGTKCGETWNGGVHIKLPWAAFSPLSTHSSPTSEAYLRL